MPSPGRIVDVPEEADRWRGSSSTFLSALFPLGQACFSPSPLRKAPLLRRSIGHSSSLFGLPKGTRESASRTRDRSFRHSSWRSEVIAAVDEESCRYLSKQIAREMQVSYLYAGECEETPAKSRRSTPRHTSACLCDVGVPLPEDCESSHVYVHLRVIGRFFVAPSESRSASARCSRAVPEP
ncbi:hypothetical protein HN011_010189 [Eciton burchellii]|nr:hypothetical protein HN011_010189 [Eciton burchellii]